MIVAPFASIIRDNFYLSKRTIQNYNHGDFVRWYFVLADNKMFSQQYFVQKYEIQKYVIQKYDYKTFFYPRLNKQPRSKVHFTYL